MLKRLERVGKTLLAWVAMGLLWRPGRWSRAQRSLLGARRILLVRIDARVGEALLTTPLIRALAMAVPAREVDVCVHPRSVALLEGCPGAHRIIPFDRDGLWKGPFAASVRALRAERYDAVVDCTNWTAPSVTSAIVARLACPRGVVIGPASGGLRPLRDIAVAPRGDTVSEIAQRLHLLSPLLQPIPEVGMSFRPLDGLRPSEELARPFEQRAYAVVNPGGRLGWRRVPSSVFAAAARALLARGVAVWVTWGPGEEALAQEVVAQAPGAVRAPPTRLDELAWVLAQATLAVCNNTGPMHLSVALGTPTLGLFLRMDPARWGHYSGLNRMLDLTPRVDRGQPLEPAVEEEVNRLWIALQRERA